MHAAVGELLVYGKSPEGYSFFSPLQDIIHRGWYKTGFLESAFYLLANRHGFWHIQGSLNLKVLPLQGDWALPAESASCFRTGASACVGTKRPCSGHQDKPGPPSATACQDAYGSGNQDKARFPRTKLDFGNRLVILDTLSTEECYHCIDLHTGLYETELKPASLSKRKPPARESRGITRRLGYSSYTKTRNWVSVDFSEANLCHSLLSPPFWVQAAFRGHF